MAAEQGATAVRERVPEPVTEPALDLHALGRRFGEREALAGIALALAPGETLAVFGPNGAGKTTLLRLLATLLSPTAGAAAVLGRDLRAEGAAIRGRIGFLGHEPLLYSDLTGRENLTFHARLHGLAGPAARIAELLEAVGLGRRADEPVRDLSRGMVQRLAVCRCVLHRPALLLLDEPRSSLDPEAEALVEPLIGRAAGVTRVLTSHDPERGLAECDRALGLRAGRQAFEGRGADVTVGEVRALYRGVRA